MSDIRIITAMAAMLLLASCAKEQSPAAVQQSRIPEKKSLSAEDPGVLEGRSLVEFSDAMLSLVEEDFEAGNFLNTKCAELNASLRAMGAVRLERLVPYDEEFEERHRAYGLHRMYRVVFDKALGLKTKADVKPLSEVSGITFYEPERVLRQTSFNDPKYSSQWDFRNTKNTGNYKAGCDINVEPVWERFTTGKSNVIVNVVDGGPQVNHPDLDGVIIPGGSNGSKNFFAGSYKLTPTTHGTHVSGTIGAINNNGIGVCGIAGGSDGTGGVKILASQIFVEDENAGSGDSYAAMVWGADHGAVISQNSWGYTFKTEEQARNGGMGGMDGAVEYFIKTAGTDGKGHQLQDSPMKGGVVIFAAGNEGWKYGWPAMYERENFIAVGAIAADYTRAYYSNYGDWVDICAPGGDSYKGTDILSTTMNSGYTYLQGTSMACPHVSGVAALIVSYFGGPGFTNDMLTERLLKGAKTDKVAKTYKIGPMLDAYGSFSFGSTVAPDRIVSCDVKPNGNALEFSVKIPADEDDLLPTGIIVVAAETAAQISGIDFRNPGPEVHYAVMQVPAGASVGDTLNLRIPDLEFNSTYYVCASAYDYSKNYGPVSEVKPVATAHNDPPLVQTTYEGDWKVRSWQTLEVQFHIYDPNFHTYGVEFSAGSKAASSVFIGNELYKFTINPRNEAPGNYVATYTATDQHGAQTVYRIEYELIPNHAPVVSAQIENMILTKRNQSVELDMSKYISDEDGEVLSYESSHSDKNVMYVNQSGNSLFLTSLNYGIDVIEVTGSDAMGETVSLTFKVAVRQPDAPVDVYPTEVKTYLYVSGGQEAPTSITITSQTGATVYDETLSTSVFEPAKIDLHSAAPGLYRVLVEIGGDKTEKFIVKL